MSYGDRIEGSADRCATVTSAWTMRPMIGFIEITQKELMCRCLAHKRYEFGEY
jgi:hypothetical protein